MPYGLQILIRQNVITTSGFLLKRLEGLGTGRKVTVIYLYGKMQPQTLRKTFQNVLCKTKLPFISKNYEFEIK